MDTNLYRRHVSRPDCSGLFIYEPPLPARCPGCAVVCHGDVLAELADT
jgi:hypothetical protein